MSFWRRLFPKYACRHCKDTGKEMDDIVIKPCRHRDMRAEFKAACEALVMCGCKPFSVTQMTNGEFRCDTCGVLWGRSSI